MAAYSLGDRLTTLNFSWITVPRTDWQPLVEEEYERFIDRKFGEVVEGVDLQPLACWDYRLRIVRYRSVRRADHSSRGVIPSVVCLNEFEYTQWRCLGPLVAVQSQEKKSYTVNSLVHSQAVCIGTARIQRHAIGVTKQIDVFHIDEFSSPSRHTMCISTCVPDIAVKYC